MEYVCSNHYEISSYCESGYECKHNLTYWQNWPFYGFGLSSASYVDDRRFSRPRRMKEYVNYIQRLEEDGLVVQECPETVGLKDIAIDIIMLSLRMARGLDVKSFAMIFGDDLAVSVCNALKPYMESWHVVALDEMRRAFPQILSGCNPTTIAQQRAHLYLFGLLIQMVFRSPTS